MQNTAPVSPEAVRRTAQRIEPYIRRTPLVRAGGSDFELGGFPLYFKLEQMQHAGSFKTRGAFANLLERDVSQAGVVAASGGNHGAAVAYAAHVLGVRAKIFVPAVSSSAKIARIQRYGAQLVVGGDRYADALRASEEWIAASGGTAVHAFDHPLTLLGQGTLAMELEQQLPGITTVLVAVGGGGLIGGIAGYFAGRVNVIGVEPEGAPTLTRALQAGHPVDAPAGSIANDSLAPKRVGELMFPLAQQFVQRVLLVSDEDIARAQAALWNDLGVLVEPGGAAAFAAVLSGRYVPSENETACVVLSGGNTSAVSFA